jgi:peptide/nickel transport system substrate-binding protein
VQPIAPLTLRRLGSGLAALAVLGAACGPAATTAPTGATGSATAPVATAPQKGGTLRSAELGGLPKILHPYPESQAYTSPWSNAATLMWANLIDVDWEKVEYVADPRRSMAKEMPTISEDGRTFTFTLRDDLKWSDGKPITSADFLFAWENASKEENGWVSFSTVVERIESFSTPDPRTIVVTLKEKLARYLAYGIASGIYAVPQHVWEGKPWLDPQANPEILKPTVVSGPYLPKEITAEGQVFARNPNWWGDQGNLDEITFVAASPTTTLELLKTRQVEWAHNFPPAQWEDAKSISHANALAVGGVTAGYRMLQFNLQRPHVQELKFRQALAYAIDRQDLVQFEFNLAEPQFGLYTTTDPYATDKVEKYAFDLAKAQQLLQEAGYKLDGGVLKGPDGQPVKIELLFPTTSRPRVQMAAYMQQQWKQLGIETVVTGMEFNAFVERYDAKKDFDIVIGSAGGGSGDPDEANSYFVKDGGQNATGYNNPRVDELFAMGAVEQDDAKRKAIYEEIQKIVVADLPHLYLVTFKSPTAVDKKVQGVTVSKGEDLLRGNNLQVLDWNMAS